MRRPAHLEVYLSRVLILDHNIDDIACHLRFHLYILLLFCHWTWRKS